MIEWIITSCVLIGIVLLLRLCLKNSISLRLRYALWLIVLVRLLVPVNFFSSPMSVMNVMPEAAPVAEVQQLQITYTPEPAPSEQVVDIPASQVPILSVNPMPVTPESPDVQEPVQIPEQQQQAEATSPEKTFSYVLLLKILWITGMVIVAAVFLYANIRFALRLRRTRKGEHTDCPLPVYRSVVIDTPCLFGLFRPAIYLTEEAGEDEGRHHILTHELTHYRHLDHIWGLLRCICLILHWYNPLVWLAAILSRRDSELACDEAVIKQLGEENRAEYGKTLIRMTCTGQNIGSVFTTATTMTGSKKTITQRIKLIVKHPKTAIYAVICLVLVAAIAVGCTFTGAKKAEVSNRGSTAEELKPTDDVVTQLDEIMQPETTDEIEYPEVMECADVEGFVTQESLDTGTPHRIFAKKYRNSENPYSYDLYVEVERKTDVLKIMLESNVFHLPQVGLFLGDVDGDKVQEILIHSNTGGVGGFGLWQTWVLKVEGGEIHILFENYNDFDTGFESQFLMDYRMKITNRFTGYNLVFDVKDVHKAAYKSAKEPPTYPLFVDPFSFFEPEDVDHDGISEIVCRQYTSHISHADYTGTAHSVLKFNKQTLKFEVIDAWYEPNLPKKELSEDEVLALLRQQMDIPHSYVIEEVYIDFLNYRFKQDTIQQMAKDGSWYYKVDRSYEYPAYNHEETESAEYYYVYEGEDLICYVKYQDGEIDRGVMTDSIMEQMERDRNVIDSGNALYPEYLENFEYRGVDEKTGLDCYTFDLPVRIILKETSMTSQLIKLAMNAYGTKNKDVYDLRVQCTALIDPETMCTMSYRIDFEELKPYVMASGSISAEYALMTDFFFAEYTFDYNLTETTILPEDYK